MPFSPLRRELMFAALALPLALPSSARADPADTRRGALADLEREAGGRLGVHLSDGRGFAFGYRDTEGFPLCSTFKAMLAAAVLAQSATDPALLARRLPFTQADLVPYSPVTTPHAGSDMSVFDLCEGTLQTNDNTAANLLMKMLGGPAAVTRFARAIGDASFRLDRWETGKGDTDLNTSIPGDPRDTTSPRAMAASMFRLLEGNALPAAQRAQLRAWMLGNKTGDARIRAGAPAGAKVADKTGSGQRGSTNDIGMLWLPDGRALALAVYYTAEREGMPNKSEVVAAATRIAISAL
jgi:beta-lactamase class A